MKGIYWLLVICAAIWVGVDAKRLGVKKGVLRGNPLDLSLAFWVILSLLLPIIGLPCYLVTRGKYQAIRNASHAYPGPAGTLPAASGGRKPS